MDGHHSHDQAVRLGDVGDERHLKSRRIPAYMWTQHRSTITKMYIDDGLELKEIREKMSREHNFDAG
jgi:hypothetical protein